MSLLERLLIKLDEVDKVFKRHPGGSMLMFPLAVIMLVSCLTCLIFSPLLLLIR